MILVLLIVIPLLAGILSFSVKNDGAKVLALIGSLITLGISGYLCSSVGTAPITWSVPWIPSLGTQFSLAADGMSAMLCLLTSIVFIIVIISSWNKTFEKPSSFWGLMVLSQTGLLGVFLAYDALVFYVFWEVALIPVYFLASRWGGEKRIQATFKFFVYTFVGSLMMLAGIIFLAQQNPGEHLHAKFQIFPINENLQIKYMLKILEYNRLPI